VQFVLNALYGGVVNICIVGCIAFALAETGRIIYKEIRNMKKNLKIAKLELVMRERKQYVVELESFHAEIMEGLTAVVIQVANVEELLANQVLEDTLFWERISSSIILQRSQWRIARRALQENAQFQLKIDRRLVLIAGDISARSVLLRDLSLLEFLHRQLGAMKSHSQLLASELLLNNIESYRSVIDSSLRDLDIININLLTSTAVLQRVTTSLRETQVLPLWKKLSGVLSSLEEQSDAIVSDGDSSSLLPVNNEILTLFPPSLHPHNREEFKVNDNQLASVKEHKRFSISRSEISEPHGRSQSNASIGLFPNERDTVHLDTPPTAVETEIEVVVPNQRGTGLEEDENASNVHSLSAGSDGEQEFELDLIGRDSLADVFDINSPLRRTLLSASMENVSEESSLLLTNSIEEIASWGCVHELDTTQHDEVLEEARTASSSLPLLHASEFFVSSNEPTVMSNEEARSDEFENEQQADVDDLNVLRDTLPILQDMFPDEDGLSDEDEDFDEKSEEDHDNEGIAMVHPEREADNQLQWNEPGLPNPNAGEAALVAAAPMPLPIPLPADNMPANLADGNAVAGVGLNNHLDNNPNDVLAINIDCYHCFLVMFFVLVAGAVLIILPGCIGQWMREWLWSQEPHFVTNILQETARKALRKGETDLGMLFKYLELDEEFVSLDFAQLSDIEIELLINLFSAKIRACFDIFVGFGICSSVVTGAVALYAAQYVPWFRLFASAQEEDAQTPEQRHGFWYRAALTVVKTGLVTLLYLCVLPTVFAVVLMLSLRRPLGLIMDASSIDRDSLTSLIVVGVICYMLSFWIIAHISTIVNEWRSLLLPVQKLLPSQLRLPLLELAREPLLDNAKRIQQILLARSLSEICQSFVIECAFLLPGLVLTVVLPLRVGHWAVLQRQQLRLQLEWFMPDLQVPGELLLTHIVVPMLVEKLQYPQLIRTWTKWQSEYVARLTSCNHWLNPQHFPHLFEELPEPDVDMPAQPPIPAPEPVLQPALGFEEIPAINPLLHPNDAYVPVLREELERNNVDTCDDVSQGEEAVSESLPSTSTEKEWVSNAEEEEVFKVLNEILHKVDEFDNNIDLYSEHTNVLLVGRSTLNDKDIEEESKIEHIENQMEISVLQHSESELSNLEVDTGIVEPEVVPFNIAEHAVVPESEQSEDQHHNALLPTMLFVLLQILCLSLVSCWIIHLPLLVGRWAVQKVSVVLLQVQIRNDLVTLPAGILLCWAVGHLLNYVWKDFVRSPNTFQVITVGWKWTKLVVEVCIGGLLWMTVLPMLVGYVLGTLFVVPFRTEFAMTPYFPAVQTWALGLVLVKLFSKAVLVGVFGDIPLRLELEMLIIRGFAHFDLFLFWQRIFVPMVLPLCDVVLIPLCIGRIAGLYSPPQWLALVTAWMPPQWISRIGSQSRWLSSIVHMTAHATKHITGSSNQLYLWRTLAARFSMHIYLLVRVSVQATYQTVAYAVHVHNEIRDRRFLIGTELTNRATATTPART
jgi:hypothetical protein